MSNTTLEERVTILEQQLAQLLAGIPSLDPRKNWRRSVGMFSGDAVMKDIQDEGRKIRDADREKAKPDRS